MTLCPVEKTGLVDHQHRIVVCQMLNDIVAHGIAQGISVPVSTTQNRLLSPWTRITGRLRPPPTGLALLISEQAFQEQACIRRNTLLREQRTYPLLDLLEATPPTTQASPQQTRPAPTTFESWLPMDSDISQQSNCNAKSAKTNKAAPSRRRAWTKTVLAAAWGTAITVHLLCREKGAASLKSCGKFRSGVAHSPTFRPAQFDQPLSASTGHNPQSDGDWAERDRRCRATPT
jgi:E4 protein